MKKRTLYMILTLVCIMSSFSFANAEKNKDNLIVESTQQEQALSSEEVVTPMSADYGVVNANGVRIRSSASSTATVLGLLYKGTEVEISDSAGRIYKDGLWWIYVLPISSSPTGWVAEKYITIYPN